MQQIPTPLILFDGECAFCNRWVVLVSGLDKKLRFHFAPIHSATGAKLRAELAIPQDLDSIILVTDKGYKVRSDAVLTIARELGGLIGVLGWVGSLMPKFIRDWCYNLFAKYRKRLFGTVESCSLLTPELKSRTLE